MIDPAGTNIAQPHHSKVGITNKTAVVWAVTLSLCIAVKTIDLTVVPNGTEFAIVQVVNMLNDLNGIKVIDGEDRRR